MRLLPLLIMTGLGFTLGLLCGLLLQLPADGLPAADTHSSYRTRRSFSADGGQGETGQVPSHQPSVPSDAEWRGSFQWDSDGVGKGPDPSGPRVGVNNLRGPQGLSDTGLKRPEVNRAEPSVGRTGEVEARDGENRQAPPPSRPVTSLTLRIKNTGEKFVVDSAVRRQAEEDLSIAKNRESNTDTHSSKQAGGHASPDNGTSTLSGVVSGTVWSKVLDESCPAGFEPREVSSWRRKASGMAVVKMEEGCGRMQNRLLTFRDGSRACARYRMNTDQIQGEVYSYYLAQLLNITHLPPAILLPVDPLSPQWRAVHLELSLAQWADGRTVVLTRWLDDLAPSFIPHELREDDRKLHPTEEVLGKKTQPELCDLLQWSDLIVFDYLTANLDRLVNNMFNRQWNAEMMNNPAHNLERTKGGSLVFLDNESGLFHGYRLLDKYRGYHEALLDSLCVFRASTVEAVKALHGAQSVGQELTKLFSEGEEHHRRLPSMPEKNLGVLQDRLARVHEQIVKCEAVFGR